MKLLTMKEIGSDWRISMQKDEVNIIGMLCDIADDLDDFSNFFRTHPEDVTDEEQRATDDVNSLDMLIDYLKENNDENN